MAIGRQFFPMVSTYKPDLERFLGEQLVAPVSIGAIEGSWRWLDPVLIISDIELKQAGANTVDEEPAVEDHLHIGSFYVHLSVIQSLLNGALQFQTIEASDITLPLHQSADGEWSVPGIAFNNNASTTDFDSVFAVLEQPSLSIKDIKVNLLSSTQSQSSWSIPSAVMSYDGGAFSASGEILDSVSETPFARFSAKGAGWILSSDFTGKLYLDWSTSPLINQYLGAYQWQGVYLDKINASGRFWLDLLKGDVLSLQGEIDVETLQWGNEQGLVEPIKNIKADVFWSQIGDNSVLSIYDLTMAWSRYRWSPSNYTLNFSNNELIANGQQLNLSMLTEILLATQILPEQGQQALADYRPSGLLTDFELSIPLNLDEADESEAEKPLFQLETNIQDVSSQAVGGAPAASGMTGYVSLNEQAGTVFVDSDDFKLSFPNLFLDGWSFEKSQVIVDWRIDNKGDVSVYSSGINLFFSEDSVVFGAFDLLLSDFEEDTLSLRVGLNNIDATRTYQFVPYHSINTGIYDWLKGAIKGGLVESGLYAGHGSIEDDAPENSFTSSMAFHTKEARLLFDAGWPELENVNSHIFLQNGYLHVGAPSVQFRDAALKGTQVELKSNGRSDESWLSVSTHTRPDASDIQYWLTESPVSENLGALSEQLRLKGELGIDITLNIPLHESTPRVEYDLSFDIEHAEIQHLPSDFLFKNVTGVARLTSNKGLNSDKITLDVLGFPATLSVQSSIVGEIMDTRLSITGDTSVSALSEQFSIEASLPVSGQTSYSAALNLSSDVNKPASLTITSPLTGVGVNLPAPLNKNASDSVPLTLRLDVINDQVSLNGQLNKMASLHALYEKGEFSRGEVFIGDGLPGVGPERGLAITGELEHLSVASWVDYLSTNSAKSDNRLMTNIDLNVSTLDIYGQQFNGVGVKIQPNHALWNIILTGDDLAGTIELPEEKPPSIDLERLRLSTDAGEEGNEQALSLEDELSNDISPSDIPELTFKVDDLIIDDVGYGQWSTDITRKKQGVVANGVVAKGVIAKNIKGSLAGSHLQGRMSWVKDPYGVNTTILTAHVDGADAGAISRALNKAETLTSEQFSTDISLVWTGLPTDFSLADLSGRIDLTMEKGTLLEAKSATEAFKVFGILNAEAIKRRLSLDFSDLYQKGLGYDRIEGVARIDKGTLTLEKPLAIQGPSSAYKFTGSANLKDQTLDMNMVVVLPLTKNLPLAALFLGAPQIGGAVWVIDKLLGEPLSKLTSATYKMTGHWDNPDIKLKNVFDRTERFDGPTPSQRRREE